MKNKERTLYMDVFDYSGNRLCPLYDNGSDSSGQATDVYITTERNGWKELSFTLPSVCVTEDGTEPNYRSDFLKSDYLIRIITDTETDWFVISEPKITHSAYSKTIQVTAGHIAQRLKFKNLGLEFSDDEGNNIGTAKELAQTILDGTGWSVGYVYPFAEKDGTTKYRSLKASAKTGAFKLMSTMCDLFDAKPIYHGDSRTVDILPINPFSEPAPGELPDLSLASEVVELHYGKNVKNVTRTPNAENIVTKMYAYGSYGDKTSGYCGLDECEHTEHIYTLTGNCEAGQAYYFSFEDDSGVMVTYHFTPTKDIASGNELVYSLLDPASMLYIWDDHHQNAYPVTKGTQGKKLPATQSARKDVQNWFQFIMNFDYYRQVGLLTDEMIQAIALYQRSAPVKYQEASQAALRMSDAQTTLSETIGYIDFCKLDIEREEPLLGNGYMTLMLDKSTYSDGVIYRTDYDRNKDNRFKWRVTDALNTDGDPVNTAAGVMYIIHDTNPVTWDKAYLKALDDEDNPKALTLWAKSGDIPIDPQTDRFFLFSYNGINGHLGTLESNDESAVLSLEDAVRVVTVDHPVFFTDQSPLLTSVSKVNGYGWLWKYNPCGDASEFYFAFTDEGDTSWRFVYFTDANPNGAEENSYWYDWRNAVLYRRTRSAWVALSTSAEKKIAALFATVFMFGKARDRYYQGLYENYTYTVPGGTKLYAGNYFIENEYNSYWTFTTTEQLNAGDSLRYNFDDTWITQTKGGIETTLKPKGYRFDNVGYHPSNILSGKGLESGDISANGALSNNEAACRTQSFISVVPSTSYLIRNSGTTLTVHYYDDKQGWLSSEKVTSGFSTPGGCTMIRLCANVALSAFTSFKNITITAENAENTIVIEDLNYVRLTPIATSGEIIGLMSCIDKFVEYADLTYDTCYRELKEAQDAIIVLERQMTDCIGDIYREGWWQDASYVDGDEEKLYADALDNLNEVAKPETTYSITYLDLYNSNANNRDFGAASETIDVQWPDLSAMSAVHLVDPEIAVNTWAFIDKIQKCYDKPWQTKITINTKLSTISQHSFTDVMTNIATVASDMKGKTSYYDKTLASAATSEDIEKVTANVSKNEKELLSTVSRVEQVGDTLMTHSSQIKQTADEISTEVLRATDAERSLSSRVKQTAESIQTEINRATEAENALSTKVTQTAQEISAEVERATQSEGKLSSSISANAESIQTEVKRATQTEGELSTKITQTAEGLSSRVANVENASIIKQTAEEVQAIIRGNPNSNNEFNTSSVSISKTGVAISTAGTFTVDSGNFEIDKDGKLSAYDVFVSGQLFNNGSPVLTTQDIVVSEVQPANPFKGMIWLKPGVPTSGGGDSGSTTTPTTITVKYSATVSELKWNSSRIYIGTNYNSKSRTGTLNGNGATTTSTKCSYSALVPLYLGNSEKQNTTVLCRLTGTNGKTVELSGNVYGTGETQAHLTCSSSDWIATGGYVSFTICTNGKGTYTNVLNSRASNAEFSVVCTATS